ncbi:MAG TPA: serine hydrolase domain-containing protein, partial [Isosphaeraceae bacterium]|nr:serine hydrolase domain-containing protein [Isosphaeraceae bacterium]
MQRHTTVAVGTWLIAAWTATSSGQEVVPPRAGLEEAAGRLDAFIREEMKVHGLPAVSIALVEGKQIVWARGFGLARPNEGIGATAETVYRVGSVSKLFTDLAVMQLVERGKLDLDAPVTKYLPDFAPRNPSGAEITLRQLMAHHSGLVRESPVGHYFDATSPTLEATVRSLNSTGLIHAPGAKTKYSNAAIATVGRVVETVKGEPFGSYVKRAVLTPLGMKASDFEATTEIAKRLAVGQMWTYDGRTFDAPTFALGTAPAGNLYSTVLDLGQFLIALLDEGRGLGGPVVKPETLKAMWTPQFAEKGATRGFGLGFNIGTLDDRRRVGHNGAVYGFATEVAALPDDGLGVAVVITKDCANTIAGRIGDAALRMLLALKAGKPLPTIETTTPLAPGLARRLDGRYGEGDAVVELAARGDSLFLTRASGGFRLGLRAEGDVLVADDINGFGTRVVPGEGSIKLDGKELKRVADRMPDPPPSR